MNTNNLKLLKQEHKNLVKSGKYLVAKRILSFMINKKICLNIGDTDMEVEEILRNLNFKPVYSNYSYYVKFAL